MKVTSRIIAVVALCAGFAQVMMPAKVNVQMFKTDPASRKKSWSYQISTKKKQDSTVSTTQLKTFTRDTKFSINDSDFETILRVYKNRTGAIISAVSSASDAKNFTYDQGRIRFDSMLISELQKPGNAIALDQDANLSIKPITEIKELIAKAAPAATRKIKIKKVGSNTDKWTIKSFVSGGSVSGPGGVYDTVTLNSAKAGHRQISVPKNESFSIQVSGKGVEQILRFTKEQASDLKDIWLDDKGAQSAGPNLEF